MSIVGDSADVENFRNEFTYKYAQTNPDEAFNLNYIIPQPENIYQENLSMEKREQLNAANIPNWYDWNIANWGTKWNTYSFESHGVEEYFEKQIYSIEFQSAWSEPCDDIWLKLAEMFPTLDFFCRADGERDSVRIWKFNQQKGIYYDDEFNPTPDILELARENAQGRYYDERKSQAQSY